MKYCSAVFKKIADEELTKREQNLVHEVEHFECNNTDPFVAIGDIDFLNACISLRSSQLSELRKMAADTIGRLALLKEARSSVKPISIPSLYQVSDITLLDAAEKLFAEFCEKNDKPDYTELASDLEYVIGIPASDIEKRLIWLENGED
jgi:hypothetical protein